MIDYSSYQKEFFKLKHTSVELLYTKIKKFFFITQCIIKNVNSLS